MARLEEADDVVPGTPSAEDGQDKDVPDEDPPASKGSKSVNGKDEEEGEDGTEALDDDEEEEEFEIEMILDAKKGYFEPVCLCSPILSRSCDGLTSIDTPTVPCHF